MDEVFRFPEKDVAATLGVTRKTLKMIREKHLRKGEDFDLVAAQICLSTAGLKKMDAIVQKKATPAETQELPLETAIKPTATVWEGAIDAPKTPRPVKELLPAYAAGTSIRTGVVKTRYRNTRIVGVMAQGELVRLKVKNSAKFVRGMEVPMRLIAEPDLYELARREPRERGKW